MPCVTLPCIRSSLPTGTSGSATRLPERPALGRCWISGVGVSRCGRSSMLIVSTLAWIIRKPVHPTKYGPPCKVTRSVCRFPTARSIRSFAWRFWNTCGTPTRRFRRHAAYSSQRATCFYPHRSLSYPRCPKRLPAMDLARPGSNGQVFRPEGGIVANTRQPLGVWSASLQPGVGMASHQWTLVLAASNRPSLPCQRSRCQTDRIFGFSNIRRPTKQPVWDRLSGHFQGQTRHDRDPGRA
jgi:hypothetical protein